MVHPEPMLKVTAHNWGEIDYELCSKRQLELVDAVKNTSPEERQDHLIFCTHPPLVTLGRSSTSEDLQGWSGAVFQSSRGGRATYHGPSQIIAYPIVDLGRKRKHLRSKDVHDYLRNLETWLMDSLEMLTILCSRPPSHQHPENHQHHQHPQNSQNSSNMPNTKIPSNKKDPSPTGVWVGEKKIASIGVAIKSWITYHGVALNLTKDPRAFQGISPCGYQSHIMTSIEEVLGKELTREEVTQVLESQFHKQFS